MTFLANHFPQMVVGLQGAFLGHLTRELPESSSVAPEYRQGLEELLEQEAPARQVADSLLFAVHRTWAQQISETHGETNISVQSFPISRIFKPIEEKVWDYEPNFGRKADEHAIKESLKGRPEQAEDVLEIRCRSSFFDLHSTFMVHQNLLPFGLHLYGIRGGFMVVRVPSFTFLESALKYCLGDQALTPCYTDGEVPPLTMNQLHLEGYHPIGMPLKKSKMHGRWAPPAEFPWHDQFHRIEASSHLPVWEQRAASVFFEVFHGMRKAYHVGWVASMDDVERLLDLNIRDRENETLDHVIARTLQRVKSAHGAAAVGRILKQYQIALRGIKGHRKLAKEAPFIAFKERIAAHLAANGV